MQANYIWTRELHRLQILLRLLCWRDSPAITSHLVLSTEKCGGRSVFVSHEIKSSRLQIILLSSASAFVTTGAQLHRSWSPSRVLAIRGVLTSWGFWRQFSQIKTMSSRRITCINPSWRNTRSRTFWMTSCPFRPEILRIVFQMSANEKLKEAASCCSVLSPLRFCKLSSF